MDQLILFLTSVVASFFSLGVNNQANSFAATDSTTLAYQVEHQIDDRISGLTAATALPLYNTRPTDYVSKWERNPNSWTLKGVPLDFTGVIGYKNATGDGVAFWDGGTLITPRHIVGATHLFPNDGTKVYFFDQSGNLVERTVVSHYGIPNTDIDIGSLNADVPSSITYYKIFDFADLKSLIPIGCAPNYDTFDIPIVSFNQYAQALIHSLFVQYVANDQLYHLQYFPTDNALRAPFSLSIIPGDSGQPNFMIVNNTPVLLFTHYREGSGPNLAKYVNEINTAINTLNPGGGYSVSKFDASGFKRFDPNTCYDPGGGTPTTDTTKPTAPTLSALAPDSTRVILSWTASTDNVGVTAYKLYKNNSLLTTLSSSVLTYTDTAVIAGSMYTYYVVAYDAAGNPSPNSATYGITVPSVTPSSDTTPPTTSITSPTNGQTVNGTTLVAANASDNVGVTKVEFLRDGSLVSTDTSSPYSFSWDTVSSASSNSNHTLQTKAYDAVGNNGLSSIVTVTVNNVVTLPPDLTPPSTPTLTGLAPDSTKVNLSWTASTDNIGVTSYKIYKGGSLLTTVQSSVLTYTDTTVSAGTTYNYYVVATDAHPNTSANSNVVPVAVPLAPDTTAPTTSVTSPTNGQTVKGLVSLGASATDAVGVTKVEFYADTTLVGTDTTSPYSATWTTTSFANSNHNLTTKAYDATNNAGQSSNVTVTVDNLIPTTSITAPTNGQTVSGTVVVTMSASDNTKVDRVDLFRDGTVFIGSDSSSPYSFSWDTTSVTNGSHTLQAKVYDGVGNVGSSAIINLNVNNTTVLPPDLTAPTAPTLTGLAPDSTKVNLSWTASTDNVGVVGYKLYKNNTLLTTLSNTVLTYTDTAVSAGTTYNYYVVATDAHPNTSANSNVVPVAVSLAPDTTAPTTPTLGATAPDSNNINVTWTASTDNVGVAGYKLYKNDALLTTLSNTVLTYTDTSVSAGSTYSYYVVATDAAGLSSANSNTVSVNIPVPPPQETQSPPPNPRVNTAPTVYLNPNINIKLPTKTITTGVSASDDGLPSGSALTYIWQPSSTNPTGATMSCTSCLSPSITLSSEGTFNFKFTASDGSRSTSKLLTIYVDPADQSVSTPQNNQSLFYIAPQPLNNSTNNSTLINTRRVNSRETQYTPLSEIPQEEVVTQQVEKPSVLTTLQNNVVTVVENIYNRILDGIARTFLPDY